jgi:hypothetical protein
MKDEGQREREKYSIGSDNSVEILNRDWETVYLAFEEGPPCIRMVVFTDVTHVIYGFYAEKGEGVC